MRDISSWLVFLTAAIICFAAIVLTLKTRCSIFDRGFWRPDEGHPLTAYTNPRSFWSSLLLTSAAFSYFVWRFVSYDVSLHLPSIPLRTVYGEDTNSRAACVGKSECVTVYLTPWCPHCRSTVDYLSSLRSEIVDKSDAGFQVIVGWDSQENITEFAEEFDPPALLDFDNQFRNSLGVSGVPLVIVSDAQYFVLRSFSGFQRGGQSPEERLDFFNERYLKLRSLK